MARLQAKRFESPDEVRPFTDDKRKVALAELSGHMVGHGTFEPGWRWSKQVKPLSGTDSCRVEQVGYPLRGEMKVVMKRRRRVTVGPDDVFHMPHGHDAEIVGDDPCVLLDLGGLGGRQGELSFVA